MDQGITLEGGPSEAGESQQLPPPPLDTSWGWADEAMGGGFCCWRFLSSLAAGEFIDSLWVSRALQL